MTFAETLVRCSVAFAHNDVVDGRAIAFDTWREAFIFFRNSVARVMGVALQHDEFTMLELRATEAAAYFSVGALRELVDWINALGLSNECVCCGQPLARAHTHETQQTVN